MKTALKIALFDAKDLDREVFTSANSMYGFNITFFDERLNPESAPLAKGYTVVCAFVNDDICRETVEILTEGGTKLLAMRSTGLSNVNLAAAKNSGLAVCRVEHYPPAAAAEHALAMLLCLSRKLHKAYSRVRDGIFTNTGLEGHQLRGKTVGIAGTGRSGQYFAALLKGFGVRVLAFDPEPDFEAAGKYSFKYVSWHELLRHSDIISLHCPLNNATVHMLDREAFSRMKPGTVVINTGRCGLVDLSALADALEEGRAGGAALDIFEEEWGFFPPVHGGDACKGNIFKHLLREDNVLVTFHQGTLTFECAQETAGAVLHNIRTYFNGSVNGSFPCCNCSGERTCPGKNPFMKCSPRGIPDHTTMEM